MSEHDAKWEMQVERQIEIQEKRSRKLRRAYNEEFGYLPKCNACKDPAVIEYGDKWLCRECALELKFGIVTYKPIHFPVGGVGLREETDPWGDNNTRSREDGRMLTFDDVSMREHNRDVAAYLDNLNDDPEEYH